MYRPTLQLHILNETAIYTTIDLPILKEKGVQLTVKREDLLFPEISGNKYRKLKYNLLAAKASKQRTLLTFGGGFSNHIAATAFAGKHYGFQTIGVIRGEELAHGPLNPTLALALNNGMHLHFISREDYRKKEHLDFIKNLEAAFGTFYLLPEGGTNALAVKGCSEMINALDQRFSHIALSVGTGGTLAGISKAAFPHQEVLGFSALKGDFLQKDIRNFTLEKNWRLLLDFHFGGYAKIKPDLVAFINNFKAATQLSLDPIYTGKMAFGLLDMIKNDHFKPGSDILMVHSGGLQAIKGINNILEKKGEALLL